ncbi:hypothetical protein QVD17_24325 [Tagetes erecta]|uniref:HAT C-terminal dimerisation domain-containing protein n=1 Tax=Tagetes erecta TaxID=13708 RepID=A0AAD8KFB0_TARER|nr:hypothetical protein QVD17_24325 [Tagetes erecta]
MCGLKLRSGVVSDSSQTSAGVVDCVSATITRTSCDLLLLFFVVAVFVMLPGLQTATVSVRFKLHIEHFHVSRLCAVQRKLFDALSYTNFQASIKLCLFMSERAMNLTDSELGFDSDGLAGGGDLSEPEMSSNKESVGGADNMSDDLVELSDEETVQIDGEESVEPTNESKENMDNSEEGQKRKYNSEAWAHFINIEVKEDGKMTIKKLYSADEVDDRVEDVIVKLKSLYEKNGGEEEIVAQKNGGEEEDFMTFLKMMPIETSQKSEVDVYLEEPSYIVLDNQEFDVLKWWGQSLSKFPVLSKMARNILSIPITTVASESAFSAVGRILDDYRSSLTKDMVELLVCGGDWIKSVSKATIQTLEQSAKEEENLEVQIPTSDEAFN